MSSILLQNARIVNEGKSWEGDVFVKDGLIHSLGKALRPVADLRLDLRGQLLLPGVIDDQVHFREPGLTHKADLFTESRAAVAGGITSFMEMPNTLPQTLSQDLLEAKYRRAAEVSAANYSFYMGASNHNLEEVLRTDARKVCGVKVFMGSSTGDMLVDDEQVLEHLFRKLPMLIATHCEKEAIIRANLSKAKEQYGDDIPIDMHPLIRSAQACFASSSQAVSLARKYGTRLHILHISTAKELELFSADIPLSEKRITAEVCVHHLWFTDADYATKGTLIKWNPAVKTQADREALRQALRTGKLDIVATDHAPHTLEEKMRPYTQAPSGAPLVQHALPAMLELARQGVYTLEEVVEKMSHAPALCFQLAKRGFIREGYVADLVVVNPNKPWRVSKENIRYKCGWSPLEGTQFHSQVEQTIVNGRLVYQHGEFDQQVRGMRLEFDRPAA
ncbi:MAG: dihydroorotase [Bacteroidetes bacterium]|nr:MAG: dihydroorotase [Bacteroidota bacterium]